MIRVLHVVSKMDRGGQETLIMNIFRRIDHSKVQFCFLCSLHAKGDYDQEIHELGGAIYYLPETQEHKWPFNYYYSMKTRVRWLTANKDKFDIIHVHTYHALDVLLNLEACREACVKKVIIHSHNTCGPHKLLHYGCRFLSNFYSYKKFACGVSAAKWLFGSKPVNERSVTIVNNGIDTGLFKYDSDTRKKYRKDLGLRNKTVIGHIGRFELQKNHEYLIDIFEEYHKINPNSVLLLVGRGSLEMRIREKVNHKGLTDNVRFLGVRNDVPSLLSAFDLFLFPSLHEGLSVCAIEVQSSGLPIITSDIASMREADITRTSVFCPLNRDALFWAKKINNHKTVNREIAYKKIRECGFDINDVAVFVQQQYLLYLEN